MLASSLDYEVTLTAVARLAVPQMAEWCVVDIARTRRRAEASCGGACGPAKSRLGSRVGPEISVRPATRRLGPRPSCAAAGRSTPSSPKPCSWTRARDSRLSRVHARPRPDVLHVRASDCSRPHSGHDHLCRRFRRAPLWEGGSCARRGSGAARRGSHRECDALCRGTARANRAGGGAFRARARTKTACCSPWTPAG